MSSFDIHFIRNSYFENLIYKYSIHHILYLIYNNIYFKRVKESFDD